MRSRSLFLSILLLGLGIVIGALAPSLKAQSPAAPCAAPWDVTTGPERSASGGNGGWHAVRWNRCTGEALVLSTETHKLGDSLTWRKLPEK